MYSCHVSCIASFISTSHWYWPAFDNPRNIYGTISAREETYKRRNTILIFMHVITLQDSNKKMFHTENSAIHIHHRAIYSIWREHGHCLGSWYACTCVCVCLCVCIALYSKRRVCCCEQKVNKNLCLSAHLLHYMDFSWPYFGRNKGNRDTRFSLFFFLLIQFICRIYASCVSLRIKGNQLEILMIWCGPVGSHASNIPTYGYYIDSHSPTESMNSIFFHVENDWCVVAIIAP